MSPKLFVVAALGLMLPIAADRDSAASAHGCPFSRLQAVAAGGEELTVASPDGISLFQAPRFSPAIFP